MTTGDTKVITKDITPADFKEMGMTYLEVITSIVIEGLRYENSYYYIFFNTMRVTEGPNKQQVEKEALESGWFKAKK